MWYVRRGRNRALELVVVFALYKKLGLDDGLTRLGLLGWWRAGPMGSGQVTAVSMGS